MLCELGGPTMGFSIYYTSTRTLAADEADAVRSAAARANAGRSWLSSEPVNFFPGSQDGKLVGGSKPNFAPHPDEARAAGESGLPDGGPSDIVNILAELSAAHSVDWNLSHDFGELGTIRSGSVESGLLAQIEAFAGIGDALGELDGGEFA
jgi:hypothetical protein